MKKPNILFIFPDQHRGDWLSYPPEILKKLGMSKLPLKMPNLKRLMENGVTFTNAVTPCPLCAPARACLASGLRYDNCGVRDNKDKYPINQKTFYSVLKESGYSVGSVGKLDLDKPNLNWGLDGWRPYLEKLGFDKEYTIDNEGKWDAVSSVIIHKIPANGKMKIINGPVFRPMGPYIKYLEDNNFLRTHIMDFFFRGSKIYKNYIIRPNKLPEKAYCDNWITRNGIKILKKFPKGKPWYFQVNFVCPHEPWDITKKMKKSWKNVSFPPPNKGKERKIDLDIKIRQIYAAMIENIDRNMGLLIEEIKKRGELDNTIIIYSSDHGEMLGDFGKYGKSMPKRGSISIPLILSGPGMKKGIYSDKLVELQDLTSTIIEYSGLSMEEAKDSISLKPLLEGKDTIHRKYQISAITRINKTKEYYPWKTIIDGRYKLIMKQEFEENKKKRYQLYSLEKDPWENNDIVDENPEIVEDLQNKIIS